MKTKGLVLTMLLLAALGSFAQEKQKRFGFELNTGISMATKQIEGASMKTGFGFEGILHYRFMQYLGVYAGWGWNRFGADNSYAGSDVCFEETGYIIGLTFKHPIASSKFAYDLRVGALYNHIETENADGDIIDDTGHGLGFQLAGGINVDLGKNWSLTPGVKFNYLSRNTEFAEANIQLDHQYISARIGIMKRF